MGSQGSSRNTGERGLSPGSGASWGREGCGVRGDKGGREGGLAQEVWSQVRFTAEQKPAGTSEWFARKG